MFAQENGKKYNMYGNRFIRDLKYFDQTNLQTNMKIFLPPIGSTPYTLLTHS